MGLGWLQVWGPQQLGGFDRKETLRPVERPEGEVEEILFLEWEDYKNNRPESRVQNQKGHPGCEGGAPVKFVCFPSLEIFTRQVRKARLRGELAMTERPLEVGPTPLPRFPTAPPSPCSFRLVLSTQLLPGPLPGSL